MADEHSPSLLGGLVVDELDDAASKLRVVLQQNLSERLLHGLGALVVERDSVLQDVDVPDEEQLGPRCIVVAAANP